MDIQAKITGIKYKSFLKNSLDEIELSKLDINKTPSAFLLADGPSRIAVSKWVSPKRTRSYPYERVYNTLCASKKITILPVVKDEGAAGDRDFLQWDTVSLMSLLDVFVILTYYNDATAKDKKITNQMFCNKEVLKKIRDIKDFHSSALHWNLAELQKLPSLLRKVKSFYKKISEFHEIKMHDLDGIIKFEKRIKGDTDNFMSFSREKAKEAQNRETMTKQPKERVFSDTKAKISIRNYLGGVYYFTVDEIIKEKGSINIVECKHSKNSLLPSISDIKDGLLKMILYSNLTNTKVDNKDIEIHPVLLLTSSKIKGEVSSKSGQIEIEKFFKTNKINSKQKDFLLKLFDESRYNNFLTRIKHIK